MPAKVALLACVVFVLILLRLERTQTLGMSRALWIPTIWILYVSSKPLGTWLGSGDRDLGSPVDQLFLSSLLCLGIFILAARKFCWTHALKENAWVALLMGYMLLSVVWSELPFTSTKRWIREFIAIVMAFVVLSDKYPREAMRSLMRRSIYVLVPFSVMLIKYFPEYGVQYRNQGGVMWVGVATQKNALGRLCLTAVFFFVWTFVMRRTGRHIAVGKYQTLADVSVFVLALYLLLGPPGGDQYSATAIVSLGVGLAAFFGLLWMEKHRIKLGANALKIIVALIIGIGSLQPFWGGSTVADVASAAGRDTTLTGRVEIWASLVPDVMDQPILGSGFGSFWTAASRERHDIQEAHNGYLDVVLGLGFVGLALWAVFLLSVCRRAHNELLRDFDWASLSICFLLMTLIHNVTETSIGSFTYNLTAILLFVSVLFVPIPSFERKNPDSRGKRLSRPRAKK